MPRPEGGIEVVPRKEVDLAFERAAAATWEESEPQELLSRRLVDYFYEKLDKNLGKLMVASTILSAGVVGYVNFSAMGGLDHSSFSRLTLSIAVFGSSVMAGAWLGFMGSLVGGMGIALLSDKVGRLEGDIR